MDFTLEVVGRTLTFDETKLPVCLLLPLLEEKNCFEGEECEQALNFKYDAPGFEPPTNTGTLHSSSLCRNEIPMVQMPLSCKYIAVK
jgi:hypothetical protein